MTSLWFDVGTGIEVRFEDEEVAGLIIWISVGSRAQVGKHFGFFFFLKIKT